MSILSFIGGIFQPAAKLIDDLHTSEEEKLTLRKEMMKIESDMSTKVLEYESKLADAQASIINAESTGHSWLQRNWRPITMMTFLALIIFNSFGWLATPLHDKAWSLLEIGLGGYVIGRSAEKIIPELLKKGEGGAKG